MPANFKKIVTYDVWPPELDLFIDLEDKEILQHPSGEYSKEHRTKARAALGNLKRKFRIAVDICRANGIVDSSPAECLAKGFLPKYDEIDMKRTQWHPKLRPYFTEEEIAILIPKKDRKQDHITNLAFDDASKKFSAALAALRTMDVVFASGAGKFEPSPEFVAMMEETCRRSTVKQEEMKRKRDAETVTSEDREAAEVLNSFAQDSELAEVLSNLAKRRAH